MWRATVGMVVQGNGVPTLLAQASGLDTPLEAQVSVHMDRVATGLCPHGFSGTLGPV